MDTAERHGFQGEGYKYLSNPIWWAGIVTSAYKVVLDSWGQGLMNGFSGDRRNRQLCRICLCAGNSGNTSRCIKRSNWVRGCVKVVESMLTMNRAVLGAYFLKEELGMLGKIGCAICLIGSLIIVLHAPPDQELQTVDEILQYAIQPGMDR